MLHFIKFALVPGHYNLMTNEIWQLISCQHDAKRFLLHESGASTEFAFLQTITIFGKVRMVLLFSSAFLRAGEPSKELSSQEAQSETLSDDHLFSLEEGVGSRSDDEAVDELIDLLEGLEKQKVSEMDLQVSGAHHPEEMLHRQSLSPTTKGVHKFDLHSRRDELETWEMSQILWDDGDSTTDGQPVNLNPVQTRPISTKAPVDDGGDWSEDDSFWDKLNLNEL